MSSSYSGTVTKIFKSQPASLSLHQNIPLVIAPFLRIQCLPLSAQRQ
jgi:hypothetical protein